MLSGEIDSIIHEEHLILAACEGKPAETGQEQEQEPVNTEDDNEAQIQEGGDDDAPEVGQDVVTEDIEDADNEAQENEQGQDADEDDYDIYDGISNLFD